LPLIRENFKRLVLRAVRNEHGAIFMAHIVKEWKPQGDRIDSIREIRLLDMPIVLKPLDFALIKKTLLSTNQQPEGSKTRAQASYIAGKNATRWAAQQLPNFKQKS